MRLQVLLSWSLLLLCRIPDAVLGVGVGVGVGVGTWPEVLHVVLGEALVLNCTYNCSSGFVRGCWVRTGLWGGGQEKLLCHPSSTGSTQDNLCILFQEWPRVTLNDTQYEYACYTEDMEKEDLSQEMKKVVVLQSYGGLGVSAKTVPPPAQTTAPPVVSTTGKKEQVDSHEFAAIKLLAAVSIVVAVLLTVVAAHLCLSRGRHHSGNLASNKTSSDNTRVVGPAVTGPSLASPEKVALRITPPDDPSDHEVPYADIMITIRGSSTPELTQVSYLTTGEHRERWREGAGPGLHPRTNLQACRSADRLHLHPREVNRKMSTSSEYAVITYS